MLELGNDKDPATIEEEGRLVDIIGTDGRPMMLKDAEGNPTRAAQMRVRGTYSDSFTSAQNRVSARNRRRPVKLSDEKAEKQDDADNHEIWGACVPSWELLINGKEADRSTIFKRYPNIYQQVISEARDHVSFSETESSN